MKELVINKNRIQSLDLLRGLVMIIMALDHVRDYFHFIPTYPEDLSRTNVALFGTRWITHFCAPVFLLLAGTSAFLMQQRKTKKELSLFLLTRGLWLIFLELTLISYGWNFEFKIVFWMLMVIWALGACMIFLAGLIWLPYYAILTTGLLLIFGHNVLDNVHIAGDGIGADIWKMLHEGGRVRISSIKIYVAYPIIPWIGVMAVGYCLGKLYGADFNHARRKKILATLGVSAIILFVVLRYSNIYGDASHWSSQKNTAFTFLSFLNTTKYPPSLLFLTMTLGPALLFLAFSENIKNWFSGIIKTFGRVPMFYYICHIYLIHLASWTMLSIQGLKLSEIEKEIPEGAGLNLGMTYVVWIAVLVVLYPICRWYDQYKSSHKEKKWLSYL